MITEVAAPTKSRRNVVVDVVGSANYITIRNRSLSPDEYRLGNSGTLDGAKLNKETVIMNLPNGTEVEVLSSVGRTYYVKANVENSHVLGYVVKSFAGRPTLKPIEDR